MTDSGPMVTLSRRWGGNLAGGFILAALVLAGGWSAAYAELLGVSVELPKFNVGTSNTIRGMVAYDAETNLFSLRASPLRIRMVGTDILQIMPTGSPPDKEMLVQFMVNTAGMFVEGVSGDDVVVTGEIDRDGDGVAELTGLLLTAEVTGFGFENSDDPNGDVFDLEAEVTGGALAPFLNQRKLTAIVKTRNSTFTGDFTTDFTTYVRAASKFSGNDQLPACIDVQKQISVDKGVTFFDADQLGDSDVPTAESPSDALYRFVVTNCGTEDLMDVTLSDETLDIATVLEALSAGAQIDVTAAEISALNVAERCVTAGLFLNLVEVSGRSDDLEAETSASDPAILICTSPAMDDAEGCTPGFWKQSQHFGSWTPPLTPTTLFADVFEDAFPGKTLLDVLQLPGSEDGLSQLGFHTVAALLNAASPDVAYNMSVLEVIEAFNLVFPGSKDEYEVLKDIFEGLNESGCPL